jgi:hypothetical protein
MHLVSIEIRNDRSRPHVVWIEPWGEDYTLIPNQKVHVEVAETELGTGSYFNLVETEGNTQVYIERGGYPRVSVDGESVECGHNRQAAIDSGIWPS